METGPGAQGQIKRHSQTPRPLLQLLLVPSLQEVLTPQLLTGHRSCSLVPALSSPQVHCCRHHPKGGGRTQGPLSHKKSLLHPPFLRPCLVTDEMQESLPPGPVVKTGPSWQPLAWRQGGRCVWVARQTPSHKPLLLSPSCF